jgi:hypothetical protein
MMGVGSALCSAGQLSLPMLGPRFTMFQASWGLYQGVAPERCKRI